jgi:hypothetical protein
MGDMVLEGSAKKAGYLSVISLWSGIGLSRGEVDPTAYSTFFFLPSRSFIPLVIFYCSFR